jgi:biotin carboxyl carrier protein
MYKATIQNRTFEISGKKNEVIDGLSQNIDILEYKKGKFHIILDKRSYSAEVLSVDSETKTCEIKVGNSILTVSVRDKYDELLKDMGIDEVAGKRVNDIKAPMPGMVLQVMVQNGQPIKKGDAIVVLEAMKMENILKSPSDGTIKNILVVTGDKVEKNQVMVNFE